MVNKAQIQFKTNAWYVNPCKVKFKSKHSKLTSAVENLTVGNTALYCYHWNKAPWCWQDDKQIWALSWQTIASRLKLWTRSAECDSEGHDMFIISRCMLSCLLLSGLSITVTCFDTKYVAPVLIIDCWFTFLIIPHTTEWQNHLTACLKLGDVCLWH